MNALKRVTRFSKKAIAMASAIAIAASTFSLSAPMSLTATAASTKSYDGITDGAILHCFCWSFNTIKANMKDIHEAGYTAIQTSPINYINDTYKTMKLMGNDPTNGTDGCWWWHYQPTDWKIGNYQMGSRDEFKAMCAEADKYGIKVIVDVVPNHTTPTLSKVSSDLKNAVGGMDNLYHKSSTGFVEGLYGNITNWGDRYQCTRFKMGGLADVDTENTAFQNYFIKYLNDCIACGADGFRYDTAKHIGLPDDDRPSGVNNNFWPRVTTEITNASNIFNYGEVLAGDGLDVGRYANQIGSICASSYGQTIRNAINDNSISANKINSYNVGSAKSTKNIVTWVESHDNYINDGTYSNIDDTEIKLAWAIITARQDGVPLFFDRPMNANANNKWGTNTIGVAGSDLYKDKSVVAVNKFREAMAGKNEYLRNPNDDEKVLMIERGNAGVVIVNTKYNTYGLDSKTNLANGKYKDAVSGKEFTVSNGYITGDVPSRSVVVLYESQPDTDLPVVNADVASGTKSTGDITVNFTIENADSYKINGVTNANKTQTYTNETTVTVEATNNNGTTKKEFKYYPNVVITSRMVYLDASAVSWFTNDKAVAAIKTDVDTEYVDMETKEIDGKTYYAADVAEDASTATICRKLPSGKTYNEMTVNLKSSVNCYTSNSGWSYLSESYIGDDPIEEKEPVISIDKESGKYEESVDVTIKVENAKTATYTINGKEESFTDEVSLTFDEDTTLEVYAKNIEKDAKESRTYTIEHVISDTITVYFSDNKGWGNVYAYTWGGSENTSKWPGDQMTFVEKNEYNESVYKVEIASDVKGLIFNNGNNGSQTEDITSGITDGTGYYLKNSGSKCAVGSYSYK